MFRITTFEICKETGITSYELRFNIGHGEKVDRGAFMQRLDADKYIVSSKRSYILLLFSRYVAHARILFDTGSNDFYRRTEKIEALDRCMKYNEWMADKSLEVIAKVILALNEDLRKILPSPSNSSYSSSESKIADMMVFCKEEMKNHPQNLKKTA